MIIILKIITVNLVHESITSTTSLKPAHDPASNLQTNDTASYLLDVSDLPDEERTEGAEGARGALGGEVEEAGPPLLGERPFHASWPMMP